MQKTIASILFALGTLIQSAPTTTEATPEQLTMIQETSLAAIHPASQRFHVSELWLRRVSWCESGWNYLAVNPYSGDAGLFQEDPRTFAYYARIIHERRSIFNPWANALVAGFMFKIGESRQWVCR